MSAAARDVEVEGRIGAVRGDDGGTGLGRELHRQAQQPVDALADHDVVDADAVGARDRGAQLVAFRVGVHPVARGRRLHRGDGLGRGPEHALVGAEPRREGVAARALLRLGSDERHEGRQMFD